MMNYEKTIALSKELQEAWVTFDIKRIESIIKMFEENGFEIEKKGESIFIRDFLVEIEIERINER